VATEDREITDATLQIAQRADGSFDSSNVYTHGDQRQFIALTIEKRAPISGVLLPPETIIVTQAPGMDSSHITLALARRSQSDLRWEIEVHFDAPGSQKLQMLTRNNLHRRLAMVLDGEAISAPTIQSEISSVCQITGNFTEREAKLLAALLSGGSNCRRT